MLRTKAKRSEYADPKENWLRAEWTTDTAAIRVEYALVDGKYKFMMSEVVRSYD